MLCLTATMMVEEDKKGHNDVSCYNAKMRLSKQKKPLNDVKNGNIDEKNCNVQL